MKCFTCDKEQKLSSEGRLANGAVPQDSLLPEKGQNKWYCSYECYRAAINENCDQDDKTKIGWQVISVIQSDDGPTRETHGPFTYEKALEKKDEIESVGGTWLAITPIKENTDDELTWLKQNK